MTRKEKLKLARRIIGDFGPNAKSELSKMERKLYEWALKFSAKQFMPLNEARAAIQDYDEELAQRRALAAAGRAARAKKKGEEPPVLNDAPTINEKEFFKP